VSLQESAGANERDDERMKLTALFRKAFARYWITWAPMSLLSRFSVVSVFVGKWICKWKRWRKNETHYVISESIRQMFGPIITDAIAVEVQCGECLCRKVQMQMKEMTREWNSLRYFGKHSWDV
jgi:hypothetical protein